MIDAFGPPASSAAGDSASEGYSGAAARADHTHAREAAPTNYVPTGAVMPYAGSSAPANWLLCDGSAVSRATYSALFTVLSTTYGVGDGSTTFNLPDMRGRVGVGVDGGAGRVTANNALAASSGTEAHTHTSAGHTHTSAGHTHTHGTTHTHSETAHSHTLSSAGAALIVFSTSAASAWMRSNTPSWTATRKAAMGGTGAANSDALSTATELAGSTDSASPGNTGASSPSNTDSTTPGDTGSTTPSATGSTSQLQPYLVLNYIVKI